MKENIAILLGAYNAENYIHEQLDSILNQSYSNWTLFLRDDNSSDQTRSILKNYAEKFENIILLEDSLGNLGCNGNYFYLLESIQADYYMFCNADDFWIKDKIKISIERMRYVERKYSNTVPIIIHTDLAITDKALNTTYDSLWNYDNINPKEMYTYNRVGVCNTIAGATMLFNEATKKITFPVSTFAPFFDHWMALKVVQAGGIIEPIYTSTVLYRQIGTNLAAINMGNTNTIVYKIKNIRSVFLKNFNEAKMLKNIGWGGYLKYIFFKFQIFLKLRFTRK